MTWQQTDSIGRSGASSFLAGLSARKWIMLLLSPAVAYYGVGYILSIGYFFDIGLPAMTAFTPGELAEASYLRLIVVLAIILVFVFVLAPVLLLVDAALARSAWPRRPSRRVDLAGAAIVALMLIGILLTARPGFFDFLMIVAAIGVAAGAMVAIPLGRGERLRRSRPLLWSLVSTFALVGLLALGNASYRQAADPATASWIGVGPPHGRVRAKLLMLGATRMIYEADGRRWLAALDGGEAIEIAGSAAATAKATKATKATGPVAFGGPRPAGEPVA